MNVDGELQVGIDHAEWCPRCGSTDREVSVGRMMPMELPSVESVIFRGEAQRFGLVLAAEVVLKRMAREHTNGIDCAFGQRCVAALAPWRRSSRSRRRRRLLRSRQAQAARRRLPSTRVAWLGTALVAASPVVKSTILPPSSFFDVVGTSNRLFAAHTENSASDVNRNAKQELSVGRVIARVFHGSVSSLNTTSMRMV